jgi:hypothetical protein
MMSDSALSGETSGSARFMPYMVKSLVWLVCCVYLTRQSLNGNFLVLLICLYLFSLPIVISGSYSITIQKARQLGIFAKAGWLFKAFSGRVTRTLVLMLASIATSFFTIMQIHSFTWIEWSIYFLTIPVFWVVYTLAFKVLHTEIKPYLTTNIALGFAKVVCPVLVSLLYYWAAINFHESISYESLGDAIESSSNKVMSSSSSAITVLMLEFSVFFDGVRNYAIAGISQQDKGAAIVILCIGNILVYYNVCLILSCFLITKSEYRRIFGNLTDEAIVPPISIFKVVFASSIFTFVTFFIYVPLLAKLEDHIYSSDYVHYAGRMIKNTVEVIDGVQFTAGTVEEIQSVYLAEVKKAEGFSKEIESSSNVVFDKMRSNVDSYLDWYYSLTAEYLRMINLVTGNSDQYMARMLAVHLQAGAPMSALNESFIKASTKISTSNDAIEKRVSEIKSIRRVVEPLKNPEISINTTSLELSNQEMSKIISFRSRILVTSGSSAVAGFSSAILLEKTVAKMVNKSIAKSAAKALAKAAASKATGSAAGAGAGAAAGAAIGSVVPGVGTVVGAAVGGVLGALSVGVVMDKSLLELEELVNREDYRRELLDSIDESQKEFNEKVRL